jgi:hypothetical protein
MRRFVFAAGLLISSASFAGTAFAQAAAEAVITHGATSGVGTGIGSALGRATSQLGERIGQQTPSVISRPATSRGLRSGNQTKLPSLARPNGSSQGSLVASIQGLEQPQNSCREASGVAASPTQSVKADASASEAPGAKCKTQEPSSLDTTHPAVINLGPAK